MANTPSNHGKEWRPAEVRQLRELARGIHPAILTEAGLGPALRSLAKGSPVAVSVRLDLPGTLETRRRP